MNRSESKYFNTAKRLDEAFLELLEKKDIRFITVKEICSKAGVNRSTFYLHYETIGDLLEECIEYINENFREYMAGRSDTVIERVAELSIDELFFMTPKYLSPYLEYVKEHKNLFKTILSNAKVLRLDVTYEKMLEYVFAPILTKYKIAADDHRYIMAYYIRGVTAIIFEWLKNDCEESIEHMISVIERCVNRS